MLVNAVVNSKVLKPVWRISAFYYPVMDPGHGSYVYYITFHRSCCASQLCQATVPVNNKDAAAAYPEEQ